jgi:hypothetical protein
MGSKKESRRTGSRHAANAEGGISIMSAMISS